MPNWLLFTHLFTPCLAVMCVFVFIGYSTISLRRRLAAKVARLTLIRGHVPAAAEVEIRHRRRHLAETAARPRIPRGECHIFPDISPSCMSASISPELHVRSLPNFARSSPGNVAMCYVLPVLGMTSRNSRLHVMVRIGDTNKAFTQSDSKGGRRI